MLMQLNFLNLKCAPAIHKTLRNNNNRLLAPSELPRFEQASLLSILQFFVNLTLAGDGQKVLFQVRMVAKGGVLKKLQFQAMKPSFSLAPNYRCRAFPIFSPISWRCPHREEETLLWRSW